MQKHGIIIKFLLSIVIGIVPFTKPVFADMSEALGPVKGDIAIFAKQQDSMQMRSLSEKSVSFINELFDKGGRFIPVENNRVLHIYKSVADKDIPEKDLVKEIATRLQVALYVDLNITNQGGFLYARMSIVPLDKQLEHLRKQIIVRSKIHMNIPFKLGKEVVYWHKNQQLNVKVESKKDNYYVISAGQWHGIKPGYYTTKDGNRIRIIKTGRYRSLAVLSETMAARKFFIINQYPDVSHLMKRIDDEITYNIHKRYALENNILQGQDPEKKLIEGLCIVNLGANICLPAYGSFLSTGYMGFDPKSPDFGGMAISLGIIALQFNVTEMMTKYQTNFFPWVQDGDKDKRTQRLQIFMWATLPLTFSATYMDQLARQYTLTRHLPPYFENKDVSSVAFSLFIPGGGMFYKGHRVIGWGYYSAEMALASYGIYHLGKGNKSLYAFSILGAIKLVEFLHTYIIKPSYDFYNLEQDGDYYRTGFTVSFNMVEENRPVYTASIDYRF